MRTSGYPAVDCCNRRLRETPDSPEEPGEPARVLQIFFRRLRSNRFQGCKIDPRTKRLALPGENCNSRGICFDLGERGHQLIDHFGRDGVAFFRATQRDRRDVTGQLEF